MCHQFNSDFWYFIFFYILITNSIKKYIIFKNMIKKIKNKIKLTLIGGKAAPNATIGRLLGHTGINISLFCKEYNNKTLNYIGTNIPILLTIYDDKSYSFVLKSPSISYLLLKYSDCKKGSSNPKINNVGIINKKQLNDIIEIKLKDFNTNNIEKIISIIQGTANSMGIKIIK
jgi:large subunit ribosomal protein L11